MNIGLVIGKKNSVSVPGKNTKKLLGRPSAEYAFIAAKYSIIDEVYVSSDSEQILSIGENYDAKLIKRPQNLAQPDTLTEDVLTHAYEYIKQDHEEISSISLLFCNNPAININLLNKAIDFINTNKEYDSCFSVVNYDMFSPTRARKLDDDNNISSYTDLSKIENVSSIRNAQDACYFCDLSIQVMNPRCFEDIENGNQPFKWQGKKLKAIKNDFGFDIDSEWQFVVIEYWLKKYGFTDKLIPWEKND